MFKIFRNCTLIIIVFLQIGCSHQKVDFHETTPKNCHITIDSKLKDIKVENYIATGSDLVTVSYSEPKSGEYTISYKLLRQSDSTLEVQNEGDIYNGTLINGTIKEFNIPITATQGQYELDANITQNKEENGRRCGERKTLFFTVTVDSVQMKWLKKSPSGGEAVPELN
jgi:hypothetical protein